MNEKDPATLFSLAFTIGSFAGLAALLRSGKQLTWRYVVSAFLNSGMFGVGVAMVWYEYYGGDKHPWFMLGVSLLAGLGGTSLIDFTLAAAKEGLKLYATRVAEAAPVPGVKPAAPETPPADPPAQP